MKKEDLSGNNVSGMAKLLHIASQIIEKRGYQNPNGGEVKGDLGRRFVSRGDSGYDGLSEECALSWGTIMRLTGPDNVEEDIRRGRV